MPFMFRFAVLSFLSIIGFAACRTQQVTSQLNAQRQLVFGSGGGFSGQVIEYTLHENGQLSRYNTLSKEAQTLHALPQKEVKGYFEQAQQLKLNTLNFKHPGNMYYFIRLKEGETMQEIVWGDTEHAVPLQVQDLYQTLEKAATQ